MIEIKLSDLIEANQALKRICACKIDSLAAYDVSLVLVKIKNELAAYDAAREAVLSRLAISTDGGATYTITPGVVAEVNTELRKLRDEIVKLEINPVQLSRFAGRELAPDDIALAYAFITKDPR